jgi:Xaa-Pro aminopeptidase
MRAHEPILLDYGICYHGYQADQTRMYSRGRMPQKFIDAYRACKEIHDAILQDVRPGAIRALFRKLCRNSAIKTVTSTPGPDAS